MSTSIGTITVNAAFLQEIKEVNQDLWRLLDECGRYCREPLQSLPACKHAVEKLRQLRDKLAMHFALEEAYGYFEDPIAVCPHLAQRAVALRAQHATLYVELAALVDMADQLLFQRRLEDLAEVTVAGFASFNERLEQHEQAEVDMIQQAFSEDIGTGD